MATVVKINWKDRTEKLQVELDLQMKHVKHHMLMAGQREETIRNLTATRYKSTGTIVRHRVAFQHLAHHWTFRFLPRSVRNHMREECI